MAPSKTRKVKGAINTEVLDEDDELSDESQKIVTAIVAKMETLKTELFEALAERDKRIEALEREVDTLKTAVCKLEDKIEDAEAYERRDTVVVSGDAVPVAHVGENCANIVSQLVKENLKLEMTPTAISVAHRLG